MISQPEPQLTPHSLDELLSFSIEDLGKVDIGRANLLCAEGLPGAEGLVVEDHVQTLDEWSSRIGWMTQRHQSSYLNDPARYDNSEPQWRLLAFAHVLGREIGVGYHEERIHSEPDWSDSQDLLIHGITGERRTGTCASLPVLVVAICRRLGYPVCLSHAPGHCFSRWDALEHGNPTWRERFNIEFHGEIGGFYGDEHYYDFPICWPEHSREMHRRGDPRLEYLHSYTRAQEFAHSLCQRAVCLEASGRHEEAINTYYACRHYDTVWDGYRNFARRSLRSRAEQVMWSLGFEPLRVRGWMAQADVRRAVRQQPRNPSRPLPQLVTIGASFGIDGTDGHGEMTLTTAQMTDNDPFGVPPTNLDAIFQTILQRTCEGTPVQPTMDLLLPHPPEAKVDPYASIRDNEGRVQLPK